MAVPGPIKIWIAALSPGTMEWAAENDYPMLTDQFSPLTRIEQNRSTYRDAGTRVGIDVTRHELPVLRHVYVGETTARAREEAARGLIWYYRSLSRVGSPGGPDGEVPENYSFYRMFGEDGFNPDRDPEGFLDFLFENCTIVGDASYCREKIAELQERCRLNHLMTWQNFGDLPHEASLASQRRFIEKVAPAFA